VAFLALKAQVTTLLEAARAAEDSADRRIARRALAGLRASSRGMPHADFRELMQQADLPGQAVKPPQ
jgi:hypothetical protein